MTGFLVVAALAAAMATILMVQVPSEGFGRHRSGAAGHLPLEGRSRDRPGPSEDPLPNPGPAPRRVHLASVVAGAALWLLVGGVIGGVGGIALALVLPAVIARLEPAQVRRERLELVRTAPLVADLLSASLAAGVPLALSIPVVAQAVGGRAGQLLLGVQRRTDLGEPMARAWASLEATAGLGGIARSVARSSRTGAPLADLLAQAATDLRAQAAAAGLEQVRATGVRAVLPLGLCLLPAFALLGIAPVVGGLLPSF